GPVVFFDGDCGLCQRSVRFLFDRDPVGALRYSALQGDLARRVLSDAERNVGSDGTLVLLEPGGRAGAPLPEGRMSFRSEAVLRPLGYLSPPWRWLGPLAGWRPLLPLFDAAYRFVVRRRLAWFGRADTCAIPDPRLRERLID